VSLLEKKVKGKHIEKFTEITVENLRSIVLKIFFSLYNFN